MAKYSDIKYDILYTTSQATQYQNYFYVADSNQTVFSDSDTNGNVLAYSTKRAQVFLNGFVLMNGSDYTTVDSGNSITLTSGAINGDEVLISVIQ